MCLANRINVIFHILQMTKLSQRKVWSHVRQQCTCKRRLRYFSHAMKALIFPVLLKDPSKGPFEQLWSKLPCWGTNTCQNLPYSTHLQDCWQTPSSAMGFIPAIYSMSVLLLAISINHINSFLLMPCIWSLGRGFSRESLVLCPYGTVYDETMSNEAFYGNKNLTKW